MLLTSGQYFSPAELYMCEVYVGGGVILEVSDVKDGQTMVDISCQRPVRADDQSVDHFRHKVGCPRNNECLDHNKVTQFHKTRENIPIICCS